MHSEEKSPLDSGGYPQRRKWRQRGEESTRRGRLLPKPALDRAFALLRIIARRARVYSSRRIITRLSRSRSFAHFEGSRTFGSYAREQRCVSPENTYGAIYTPALDGLIDRPIAPYLFIFHRVLAPGAISSFSFRYVRTRGGKKYEILTPVSARARVALYQFFSAWHRRRNLY